MQTYPTTRSNTVDLVRSFMARTYSWMAAGLVLTAGVAYLTAQNADLYATVMNLRFPLMLAQLGLVFFLSMFAQRVSSTVAGMLFIAYAGLTGLTFSSLLSAPAVVPAFLTAAGTFAATSAAGFLIKRDLSGLGRFFMFAVIGLLVAMLVNMFVMSSGMSLIISVVGVLLFAGLTVYDTQMLRNLALSGVQGEMAERAAINGALALYLDFINMFLMLLNLFNRD